MSRRFRFRAIPLALVAALAALVMPTSAAVSAAPTTPTVAVTGAVATPLKLTTNDLKKMPSKVRPVVYDTSRGTEVHIYRGPLLYDVLQRAKPAFDPAVRNDQIRHVALATATDDYRAAISWGEIAPEYAGQDILVAHTEDGKPLNRPRLVVPTDEKGSRYVSDLVSLKLVGVS